MRIRNLYDPPALKDRDPVVPWVPDGMTASARLTAEGCEITVTGDSVGWLYPPEPRPDGLANVTWQQKDGSYLIGIRTNDTVAISPGVTVLVRLCGYEDDSLVTMLKNLGLPLVFAASDHPY
ncbi:hypothetical protein [Bifidobacterium pseudocatenulatum]|uniref:hypothetical protein n=1 Tax=Bifidobacterium pseudocatenulatum TaxID=28026 RepID=UPI001F1B5C32|nr:hypothetical protein [Bifidobacterium pseudocatenulatum]UIY46256.1 hypothetical protein L0J99_07160 [Bifidobacterium pseudocatenulatum]